MIPEKIRSTDEENIYQIQAYCNLSGGESELK